MRSSIRRILRSCIILVGPNEALNKYKYLDRSKHSPSLKKNIYNKSEQLAAMRMGNEGADPEFVTDPVFG